MIKVFKKSLIKASIQQRLTPAFELDMVVGMIGGYNWYKYINVEGRGMKWHLMLKEDVCVANRINGSKAGGLRSSGMLYRGHEVIR
jgi:hypothetical protein